MGPVHIYTIKLTGPTFGTSLTPRPHIDRDRSISYLRLAPIFANFRAVRSITIRSADCNMASPFSPERLSDIKGLVAVVTGGTLR